MKILLLFKDKYVLAYLSLYLVVLLSLSFYGTIHLNEILFSAFLIGFGFTTLAYLLTKASQPLFKSKDLQKKEPLVILLLCMYFVVFITFYQRWLPLNSDLFTNSPAVKEFFVDAIKFLFIVLIPIIVYRLIYGFSLRDWGIVRPIKSFFTRGSIVTFMVFLLFLTLFQFYFSNGAKPIREGVFSFDQLFIALPLYFIWLVVFVGIVEEYFFRVFLQSRIAIALNSQIGGIILSSVIFGLAHAPGIYLRGGGVIANLGSHPTILLSIAYSFLVLSVAGFFLSVIWVKTKNFWLIALIHASVDLLPGLTDFIRTFHLDTL